MTDPVSNTGPQRWEASDYRLSYDAAYWVDNNKVALREIGWDGMDWIDLAQNRDQWRALVNTAMNLRGSIECWEVLE
jgi:hypothetical protein